MDPQQIPLLGYTFNKEIYFDVTLSMGSRSAAYCCQRTTNCITYIFKQEGFHDINYLDDLGGAETADLAEEAFQKLKEILQKIGIEESADKAVPPSFMVTFLGIFYNTISMTMEITP